MTGGLNNFTQTVEEIDECYKKYNGYNPLISYELGFHAEYTCSRELLEGMASIAKKHQAPVFVIIQKQKKKSRMFGPLWNNSDSFSWTDLECLTTVVVAITASI